jgi:hypothetical protein
VVGGGWWLVVVVVVVVVVGSVDYNIRQKFLTIT